MKNIHRLTAWKFLTGDDGGPLMRALGSMGAGGDFAAAIRHVQMEVFHDQQDCIDFDLYDGRDWRNSNTPDDNADAIYCSFKYAWYSNRVVGNAIAEPVPPPPPQPAEPVRIPEWLNEAADNAARDLAAEEDRMFLEQVISQALRDNRPTVPGNFAAAGEAVAEMIRQRVGNGEVAEVRVTNGEARYNVDVYARTPVDNINVTVTIGNTNN